MHSLGNDRRLHRRYWSSLTAELRTQDNESILCRIVDISQSGAAVECENIADELSVSLRLQGFGALNVSRLRASPGSERLIVRETDLRTKQFVTFISNLIVAGKALPLLTRRRSEETPNEEATASSYAFGVRQTLNLIAQVANHDGELPDNVALFPRIDRRSENLPPDIIA